MSDFKFEWDKNKNASNLIKHGVSFEEAMSVFYDEKALLISDPVHSVNEDRFILLGLSYKLREIVVVHIYKENDQLIRIISARKTTKNENNSYYGIK